MSLMAIGMNDTTACIRYDSQDCKSDSYRKSLGQYFTRPSVSEYMAGMIDPVGLEPIRILDAGAGAGILTVSAALRCFEIGITRVHAVLFEIDGQAISKLTENMDQLSKHFQIKGGRFTYDVHNEDFVLARPDKTQRPFHISSINPPYFRYNSRVSSYAGATADLFKGDPNIYASFMAVVAACLAPNGQMVSIVPRSFTNGLYFRGFRQYINKNMSLDKIHIFQARDSVFKELSVLQENIICLHTKRSQSSHIEVITSTGYEDLNEANSQSYPANLVIDDSNDHQIIRIPETAGDAAILQMVEAWASSFQDNGYFISTGPVVEHRAQEYILPSRLDVESVPLLRMHNVKAFNTVWTGTNKKDARFALLDGHHKHTSDNQPYVLLKRFSSKDEKRRLVAGVYDPGSWDYGRIALENHLNFIGRTDGELPLSEAYGLATLFNSTLMDRYFRCISGNTQVNATEIRLLKLPERDIIKSLGEAYLQKSNTDQMEIDSMVGFYTQVITPAVA